MVFSSLLFMFIYLPVTLAVYYIVPFKWRNIWLFIVNLVFYGWGEPVYILLMIFSIVINYISGLLVEKHKKNRRKSKTVIIICVAINLAMLMFFKYYDFLAENIRMLPFLSFIKPLGVTLPIGISFYTFQTMSYPIDVYRNDAKVQRNFINFGTFVALFPQLIAGPIVRYKDIAEQLDGRRENIEQFASGVRRFAIGLAKKVLFANSIGALWDVFKAADPAGLSAAAAWLGAVAFTFQIYFDFSGYSDMAIGLGRMMGFEFLENFNYPYISKSVTEFWHRWHISLSTWFRDYVYIPLGGNRKGLKRQFINIFIVWALTGFWHGASWNFLLWGVYYAVLLIIEKSFLLKALDKAPKAVGHIYTMIIVIVGWVLFSVEYLPSTVAYVSSMFGGGAGFLSSEFLYYIRDYGVMLIILIAASTPLPLHIYRKLPKKLTSITTPLIIVLILVLSTAYLVDSTYNPFLYFRF